MIIIHAVFNINPAKQDAFLEEIQPLIAASRAESGNVSYNLHKATEKDNEFTMVEVWQDHLAVAGHNSSEHFTSFVGKAKEFLSSPLIVNAFEGQPLK
ncbi:MULTISPECIES: putative quinol monooxygenase [Peribacillus]|uniref:putative quinol monooxygenase n=1 Tax=Peribacillus TaxID=2675229 RepID=UPI001F4F2DAB|nr:putative quinol monooxygenase [Peribacillus frigoritolerans]MCK2021190.1 antibiotic biosynthesis monooxygenase [Peribacillus frigoritolerans]MED3762358.1 putative quinol monooxygenase [Peribacillus frigoritolerans]WHY15829.1 putative quinol monooxygenase [Peribacillus frigoritolerans]